MGAIDFTSDTAPKSGPRASSARASVRIVGRAPLRRDTVVEIVGSHGRNPLHDVFVALQSIGVDIVHARVRAGVDGASVQQFHLLEPDGRALSRKRLSRVLYRLASTTGVLLSPRARSLPPHAHEGAAALAAS